MDVKLNIMTDCASIAIFDPAVLTDYARADLDQWPFETIGGVQERLFCGFATGGDGVYRIRVTDQALTVDERDYAAGHLSGLGLRVKSACARIGGYGFQKHAKGYESVAVEPGAYSIEAFEILWDVCPRWWREEHVVPEDAPPDFVLIVGALGSVPAQVPEPLPELRLETLYSPYLDEEPFLFESTTRRVGTEVGAILISTVIKSPKAPRGFRLKECGIEDYKADLDDYHGLAWHDRVRFRVTAVDHKEMLFRGVLLNKPPPKT